MPLSLKLIFFRYITSLVIAQHSFISTHKNINIIQSFSNAYAFFLALKILFSHPPIRYTPSKFEPLGEFYKKCFNSKRQRMRMHMDVLVSGWVGLWSGFNGGMSVWGEVYKEGLVTHMDAIVAAPLASGRSSRSVGVSLWATWVGTGIGLHL